MVSHGKFRNYDFIVAERSGRFIGKLRLRQVDETALLLDPPVVLPDFNFYEVARALVERAIETTRAEGAAHSLRVPLDGRNNEKLRRVYEHTGLLASHR